MTVHYRTPLLAGCRDRICILSEYVSFGGGWRADEFARGLLTSGLGIRPGALAALGRGGGWRKTSLA